MKNKTKPVPGTRYRKVWCYDSTTWRRRVKDQAKFKAAKRSPSGPMDEQSMGPVPGGGYEF